MGSQAERHLSIPEAARLLNVSKTTVLMRCLKNVYPRAYQIKGPKRSSWKIPEMDLENKPKMGRPRKG